MVRRIIGWIVRGLVLLLVALAGLYGVAYWKSEQALTRHYLIADAPLPQRTDAEAVARGEHLYSVLGCVECHGAAGIGKLAIDAGPAGRYVAPNLTPGHLPSGYDDDGIGAAIRHGVGYSGAPLRLMPSADFQQLSDADTAALVGYLRALPASDNDPGQTEVGPLARVLYLFDAFHLVAAEHLDHTPRVRAAPEPAPTAAYGAYLAQACTGCHGPHWAGQHVPGTPPELPDAANLTPHDRGLAGWQLGDFEGALRHGRRPDGRALHPFMPWAAYAAMSDDDVAAIWAHLQTLPPLPHEP